MVKKNYLQCRRHGFPIVGRERSGERIGNPLQYPCWENFLDRAAWQAIVHGVGQIFHIKKFGKAQTASRLHTHVLCGSGSDHELTLLSREVKGTNIALDPLGQWP